MRVRPAFAGEGRYFVVVPKGTNCDRFALGDEERLVTEEDAEDALRASGDVDPEAERAKVELYTRYLEAQVRRDERGRVCFRGCLCLFV